MPDVDLTETFQEFRVSTLRDIHPAGVADAHARAHRRQRRQAVAVAVLIVIAVVTPLAVYGYAVRHGSSVAPAASGSASPAASTASSPPASSSPAPTRSPGPLALNPTGYGPLTLGMTPEQAFATGLVTRMTGTPSAGHCDFTSHFIGLPRSVTSKGQGVLVFSPDQGLAAIYAYPGMKTVSGIKIGSSLAQLERLYPTWPHTIVPGTSPGDGRGYQPAGSDTTYRIVTTGNVVDTLSVELSDQNCYE
jgi:hypothetical protein